MADYVVRNMPYDELVEIVEELRAKHIDDTPDYLENNPAKRSYIRNRLFYEEGEPGKEYFVGNLLQVDSDYKISFIGTGIIDTDNLDKYSITVDMESRNSKQLIVNKLDSNIQLSLMTATPLIIGEKVVGYKYSTVSGAYRFYPPEIHVVIDYSQYYSKATSGRKIKFPTNGVYLTARERKLTVGADTITYTTLVSSLTRTSTLKIHRIPNKFIDLDRNKTFLELKKRVEEGGTGSTVEKIASIDTYFDDVMSNLRLTNKGITWNGEFMIASAESEMAQGTILHKMPIVAGENINFEADEYEGTPIVKLNADTPSWDGLQDRPFGENCTVHDTLPHLAYGDRLRVSFNGGSGTWIAYQVSENTYDKEQLLGGKISATSGDFTIDESHIVEDTEDGLKLQLDQPYYPSYYIWVARTTNYQPEGFDAPFPAVGLYWSSWTSEGDFESLGIHRLDLEYIGIKKLDNEFLDLPNNTDFKALQQKVEEGVVELTIPTTYAELKALRDSNSLIAGCFYRITDYRCTSVQKNTRAMDNRFDIIVRALSSNTLSETASADHHEGDTYFAGCNLAAWELKYCLDNDTTRFAWALDYGGMVYPESALSNGMPLKRIPDADGALSDVLGEYRYAWGTQADADDGDTSNYIYSKTETVSTGDIVFSAVVWDYFQAEMSDGGKGVIYHMKDENGNECPYDFKNIQFKRYLWLEDGYPMYDAENGDEYWVYTFCGRSYHIDNDEWSELKDGSLESPYAHMNDEGPHTFFGNVIKPYTKTYDDEDEIHTNCGKMYLNNNVLLGWWEEIGSSEDEFNYYYAQCCWGNTIGLNCHDVILNYACYGNTFGIECAYIVILSHSGLNNFGNWFFLGEVYSWCMNYIESQKVSTVLYQHNIRITPNASREINGVKYYAYLYKTLYNRYDTTISNMYNFLFYLAPTNGRCDICGTVKIEDSEGTYFAPIAFIYKVDTSEFKLYFIDKTGAEVGVDFRSSYIRIEDNVTEV